MKFLTSDNIVDCIRCRQWKQKLVNLQFCDYWWHCKLSLWQLTMPPVMTKLSNWGSFVFSWGSCHSWGRIWITSSPPGQNGHHFTDIFKHLFMVENAIILIEISLKFILKGPINNKSALVQVMTWRWAGAKPSLEPMASQFAGSYMQHSGEMSYMNNFKNISKFAHQPWDIWQ